MPPNPTEWHVGIVGYGEVGRILAEDLRGRGVLVSAYDIKLGTPEEGPLVEHAARHGVRLAASHVGLAAGESAPVGEARGCAGAGVDLIISSVTASQTVIVAWACARGVRARAFFLDLNSASPGAKCEAAGRIDGVGGRYVEGAVMTSVPPYRSGVPLLLGGPHAEALLEPLKALGFTPTLADARVGVASATKMCRSVMIKGLEAMVIESLTTARHYGVEDAVLASLQETFPGIEWERQASYFFQRVIQHGRRRSEEMVEVAETVREAGLDPFSARGTAERQADMARLADAGVFGERGKEEFARSADWREEADRILASRTNDEKETA